MGVCASDTCASAEFDESYVTREIGYPTEGQTLNVYIHASGGANTSMAINTAWSSGRLKRELRTFGCVPEWHWCTVHVLKDLSEIKGTDQLARLSDCGGEMLRLEHQALPESMEGVVNFLKATGTPHEAAAAGLSGTRLAFPEDEDQAYIQGMQVGAAEEIGHQIQDAEDDTTGGSKEVAQGWWEAGALPALCRLLSEGTPEGKAAAAWGIWNLMGIIQNQPVEEGVVHLLMAVLETSSLDGKESAAGALGNVIVNVNKGNAHVAAELGVVPHLVDLIDHAPMTAKDAAARTLCNLLLADPTQQQAAVQVHAVGALLKAIEYGSIDLQEEASQALLALFNQNDAAHTKFRISGGKGIVNSALRSANLTDDARRYLTSVIAEVTKLEAPDNATPLGVCGSNDAVGGAADTNA